MSSCVCVLLCVCITKCIYNLCDCINVCIDTCRYANVLYIQMIYFIHATCPDSGTSVAAVAAVVGLAAWLGHQNGDDLGMVDRWIVPTIVYRWFIDVYTGFIKYLDDGWLYV